MNIYFDLLTKKEKMKRLFKGIAGTQIKTAVDSQLLCRFNRNAVPLILSVLLGIFLLNGCSKQDIGEPDSKVQSTGVAEINADMDISSSCAGLSEQTKLELQEAREATLKYCDIKKATVDGYADINVVMQNMGYHYMKSKFADAKFEIKKP